MSQRRFDVATEANLVQRYLHAAVLSSAKQVRDFDCLTRMCKEFRSIRIGESILEHTQSTDWIREWLGGPAARSSPTAQERRIATLRRWWSWLFYEGVIDDNVLTCFRGAVDLLGQVDTPLTLTHNLQRQIARYLDKHGPGPALSSKHIRWTLGHFNVFLNRRATSTQTNPSIDEEFVIDWFRNITETRSVRSVAVAAGHAAPFLDFLVELGQLRHNPLTTLWARYDGQQRLQIAETVLELSARPLQPTPAKLRFVSPLAQHLDQFLDLKRAMGRKYEQVEEELMRFDRFVADRTAPSVVLSRELVEDWLLAGRDQHARTKKKRVSLIRQFALYLVRIDPATYVPGRSFWPTRLPQFKAYIYSEQEYRALLTAALELRSPRSALRPQALFALLLVLYSTGIRVGEATRLKLADVNLEAKTLLIKETKFFKSRVVPFSNELAERLKSYLDARNRLASSASESPFFVNNRRHAFAASTVANTFRRLLAKAGVPYRPTAHRPRVHDIRHTFACARVLRWYREGRDVTAKLPLLATYMGHVSVMSTEIYLRSTSEILGEASSRFEVAYAAVVAPEVKHESE